MKNIFFGILLVVIIGIGGFVYRNAAEHPSEPIACPMDARLCPDGTAVSRVGSSCTFAPCPLPNISLPESNISFALPAGFAPVPLPDTASIAAYQKPGTASSTSDADIIIRRFPITASSTALQTIQQTAINMPSGLPVSATSFTSTVLGGYRFTVVQVERFEGMVDTAYYLAHGADVLRFDAIDRTTAWTDPALDVASLPSHAALRALLVTLQGQ